MHYDQGMSIYPDPSFAVDNATDGVSHPCQSSKGMSHCYDATGLCEDCGAVCDHDSGDWAEFPGEPRRFLCESCGIDLTDNLREYNV